LVKTEEEAKQLLTSIEQVIDNKFQSEKDRLATKENIAHLETKIIQSKSDILKWLIVLFLPFNVGMIVFLIKQFA
jgi:hypothetical protein